MPESSQKNEIRSSLLKYAASILGRRPYFRHILREKLIFRAKKINIIGQSDCHSQPDRESIEIIPIIDNILDDLSKCGYLDDVYLAEAYVRRQLGKCYGPKIITLKLKQLRLNQETINSALFSEATKKLQQESINKFMAKNIRLDQRKLAYKLYSRGFSSDLIKNVFDGESFPD